MKVSQIVANMQDTVVQKPLTQIQESTGSLSNVP